MPVTSRARTLGAFVSIASLGFTLGCGSDSTGPGGTTSSGSGGSGGGGPVMPTSQVQHLVVIIQENHTFDNHFGRYCTAPTGSNPSCNAGPSCCERGPDTDPGTGTAPTVIDDAEHAAYSPDHGQDCEIEEMNGGAMDRFVDATCGNAENFAYSDPALVKPYWDFADQFALADRYFQPIAGASSSNDMYFARANFVFTDNAWEPQSAVSDGCTSGQKRSYTDKTIGDLMNAAGVQWAFYAEGYQAMKDAHGSCPPVPTACGAGVAAYPCIFDPGDVPFQYYSSLVDASTMRDLADFEADLAAGTLPAVSFVKLVGYKTEHPGANILLSDGVKAVADLAGKILSGPQKDETLLLVAYDEGGGYFDHVAPPPDSAVDTKPYGTRLPFLALGPFAKVPVRRRAS
jgi:phospholipase C